MYSIFKYALSRGVELDISSVLFQPQLFYGSVKCFALVFSN